MRHNTTRNFHLPLPDYLYDELRSVAAREQVPATTVARQALEDWLRQKRRNEIHEELTAYATKHAGTPADLDVDLERAAVEVLRGRGRSR